MRTFEASFKPDLVFTVFGPAFYQANAPHLVGFALPDLIYAPELPALHRHIGQRLADDLRCRSFQRADHLAVETETARNHIVRTLHIPAIKISVVGNSVNPLLHADTAGEPPELGPFRVLVPSAYYVHKNLEIVPAVAAEIGRLRPSLAFEFALTLDSASSKWANIHRLAKQLGVVHRISTLGVVPLAEARPSLWRGLSGLLAHLARDFDRSLSGKLFFRRCS